MTALLWWFLLAALGWSSALLLTRFVLQRSSAGSRYFVLAASFVLPAVVAPVLLVAPHLQPARALRSSVVMIVTPEGLGPAGTPATASARSVSEGWPVWPTLFGVWAGGLLFALARVQRGWRSVTATLRPADARIEDEARRVGCELGLRRSFRVMQCTALPVAHTFGWFRPVVVLPLRAEQWPEERLNLVLRHELTHILRQDWPVSAFASFVAAVHWFNPLAHYALRRLFAEREMACDDDLLRQGVDGCTYAEQLLAIVSAGDSYAVAMAQTSHLEARIRSLISSEIHRGGISMNARIGTAALAGVLLSMAVVVAAPQSGNAALSGTVLDASSARVPFASVVVRNSTGGAEIVRTNEAGEFTFQSLPAGEYTVEVAKRGFRLWTQPKVMVSPASAQNITVVLELGRINETIEVNGGKSATTQNTATRSAEPKQIRIGGDVQAAKLVKAVRPSYPQHLKTAGVQGTVLMEAIISREGNVRDLKVLNVGVHPDFATVAREAVSQWRYEPTYLNGEPVEIIPAITVNFTLMP